jgi:hypothetical protein
MKDTTILRIKVPKKLYESVSKQLIRESEDEQMVKVTLDEYTGSSWEYDLGKWTADNWPAIADALKSTSTDPGQAMADLGGQVMTLATAGTVMLSAGLAVAKDSIVAAAKKVKEKLANKEGAAVPAISEGLEEGDDLSQILAKVPEDIKSKVQEAKPKPEDKKELVKEYERIYKMIDGQCYRVDDEGNKVKVNSKYCN